MHGYQMELLIAERQHEIDRALANNRSRAVAIGRRGLLGRRAHGRR